MSAASTLVLGFTVSEVIYFAVCLPLLSGVILLAVSITSSIAGQPRSMSLVKTVSLLGPVGTFLLLIMACLMVGGAVPGLHLGPYFTWLHTAQSVISLTLLVDPLSLVMAFLVIGSAVFVIATQLTRNDPFLDDARYYTVLHFSLFFLLLVMFSESGLWLLLGWEGMALSTYLLFRFCSQGEGDSVFFLTRVTNMLLWIALFASTYALMSQGAVETDLFSLRGLEASAANFSDILVCAWVLPVLVYLGLVPFSLWFARTAQGPLLPLAWIHSVGLISAGVYVLARLNFLLLGQETLRQCLEILGAVTVLLGACLALFMTSLRRVLVYSTVSQSGLVLLAYATGAFSEGILHWSVQLMATLLIILSMGQGGRLATLALFLGCGSLAGALPLAGFFTRYDILWHLFSHGHWVSWGMVLLGSLLTAIYATRLYVLSRTAAGVVSETTRAEPSDFLSGFTRLMLVALLLGMTAQTVMESVWGRGLLRSWLFAVFEDNLPIRSQIYGQAQQMVMAGGSILILFHVGLVTYLLYTQRRIWIESWAFWARRWIQWVQHDFYLYETMRRLFIAPFLWMAEFVFRVFFERQVLQGVFVEGLASGVRLSGRALSRLNSGLIQQQLFWYVVGVALLLLWVLL